MTSFQRRPVENLLSAKSIAIVGASPKGRWPMGIYRNLKKAYKGKVFLINPNYQEIENNPCYPNLAALPEVPEELLILIPTRAVLGTLERSDQTRHQIRHDLYGRFRRRRRSQGEGTRAGDEGFVRAHGFCRLRAELHGFVLFKRRPLDVSYFNAIAKERSHGSDLSERWLTG